MSDPASKHDSARMAASLKGAEFRRLHEGPGLFLIPNPWDIGTAKFLGSLGFKALATTSAGFAFTRGLPDGGVRFDTILDHCRELSAALDLPVSADLEKGLGDSPRSAAESILAAAETGLAGCSLEDHTGDPGKPIYDFSLAVERVAAAAEAAKTLGRDFVFTARAENFLWERPDIEDTILRLRAFEDAGASVLYAPGIENIEFIREICSAVRSPVNVLLTPRLTVEALCQAGVRRVSVGSKLATLSYGALYKAAVRLLEEGKITLGDDEVPFETLQRLFLPAAERSLH